MKLKLLVIFLILSNYAVAQESKYKDSELINQWITQSITSTKADFTQNVEVVHSIVYVGDGRAETLLKVGC